MTLSTQSLAMCPVLLFLSYFYRQITLCSHAERARGGFPRHSPFSLHLLGESGLLWVNPHSPTMSRCISKACRTFSHFTEDQKTMATQQPWEPLFSPGPHLPSQHSGSFYCDLPATKTAPKVESYKHHTEVWMLSEARHLSSPWAAVLPKGKFKSKEYRPAGNLSASKRGLRAGPPDSQDLWSLKPVGFQYCASSFKILIYVFWL